MKVTDQTLFEQMGIGEIEIDHRKALFSFTAADRDRLIALQPAIALKLDQIVEAFYQLQTSEPDIAVLIGDSDTLERLKSAQKKYITDMFSGCYGTDYVNNRLRIGLVHKRIGVEPKLYLAAVQSLKALLGDFIIQELTEIAEQRAVIESLEKLMAFDVSLVFDTYIRSLVSEIEVSKRKVETYANALEHKVKERTEELEKLSRTDPLTGLLNSRVLIETLTQTLHRAQRRSEPVTMVYIDVNDFKVINDTEGHLRGDKALQNIGWAINSVIREEDYAFRYGGDEFCMILSNCTAPEAEHIYENRLIEALLSKEKGLTLSIGYAQTGPDHYIDMDELIMRSDQAMYEAKRDFKAGR